MKVAIENTNGQWWTGQCWGVEQAREVYEPASLPLEIDKNNDGWGEIVELIPGGPEDSWKYWDTLEEDSNYDAIASVRILED